MANDDYRTPQQAARDAGLAARHETRVERAIRRQVAEEIAQALEAVEGFEWALAGQSAGVDAARIARDIGSNDGQPPPKLVCRRCNGYGLIPSAIIGSQKLCPDCTREHSNQATEETK